LQIGRGLYIWLLCLCALWLAFLGAQLHPLVYLLAGVLLPLPVLVAGWRLGERAALALALAAVAFLFALNPGLSIFWQNLGFLNLLLMGVLLSSLQYRGMPPPQAIILTVVVLITLAVLFFLGQAFLGGIPLRELLAQKSAELMDTVRQVLGESGAGSAGGLIPGVPRGEVEAGLQRLLPGLVVTNTALVAWINVILSRQIAFLLSGQEPEPPMYYWEAPQWLIFALLGAGFLLLLPVSALRLLSLNLLLVLGTLYFCQGVAVVAAWFHRLRFPRWLRMVGYPVLFLNPFFFVIITLGLMDLWLDFRRLHHQPKDA
jgi:uncharacterized protein YybS (DUF2232 family)